MKIEDLKVGFWLHNIPDHTPARVLDILGGQNKLTVTTHGGAVTSTITPDMAAPLPLTAALLELNGFHPGNDPNIFTLQIDTPLQASWVNIIRLDGFWYVNATDSDGIELTMVRILFVHELQNLLALLRVNKPFEITTTNPEQS